MMVESERPHRNSGSTSELFICFSTSRLSSSSMKLSSKSLLSPARSRDQAPQISLSSSLSRRLRTSGSIKGGASPMFPSGGTGTKKRAGGFENPEPSSPKVTCIGQVRVKTKKQGKKMRMISSRSKRSRSGGGGGGCGGAEASFRKAEQNINQQESFQTLHFPNHQISSSSQRECLRHRNQRWVHLPLTICEALRAFGSEFNCLIPNKSSCLSGGEAKKDEENKGVRSESGNSSCGAVFARWFVALGDGEDGNKRREIELVVGEEEGEGEEITEITSGSHSLRRQVFEGIEFKEEALMTEQEEGRVSICVPPKNALLLMRCRSDPVKMAALGNRFWEMPAAPNEEEYEEEEPEDEDEGVEDKAQEQEQVGLETELDCVCDGEQVEDPEEQKDGELNSVLEEEAEDERPEKSQSLYEVPEVMEEKECQENEGPDREEQELNVNEPALVAQEAVLVDCSLAEVFADPQMEEMESHEVEEAHEEEMREAELPISEEEEQEQVLDKVEEEEAEAEVDVTEESTAEEEKETRKSTWEAEESPVKVTEDRPEPEPEEPEAEMDLQPKRSSQSPVLPDCLLLMMCEPKLSMEVSKETWVCSTDFIRCLPERHVSSSNKKDGKDEAKKPPRVSIDSKASNPAPAHQQQQMMQPPRSSCSFPIQAGGPVSMAEIIGQKLVGSAAYEPFVLTRCKSEPMRSASKLAPEACFWNNRKLEPHHRPGPLGVGATGVGF